MKTILEAIKLYPQEFIDTVQYRAETTPSSLNRGNHHALTVAIESKDWQHVEESITDGWYKKPLEGVIFCLERYSEMDKEVWMEIVQLWEDGKLV